MDTELAVIPPIDNEEQMIYGEVSGAQYRHLADPLHRNASGNIQNSSSMKKDIVLKHDGEFSFSKDFRLNTVAEIDHFKNLSNSTVKSEPLLEPHSGFEDYHRHEPSLSAEKTNLSYAPPAQQHSCNVHLLSTFLTQHRNHTLLPLNNWPCSGKAHHNVRLIPVLRQIVSPVTGGNNFICYEPWKEGMNNAMEQPSDLPVSADECFDGLHTTRSNGDDFAEVKSAVASITDSNKEQTDFPDQNVNEMSCKLLSSQEHLEAATCSQTSDSGSLVFCHLKGGTPLLCLNSPGTSELKQSHMVPPYQGQHNSIQLCPKKEDVSNQLAGYPRRSEFDGESGDMALPTAVGRFLSGGATPNLTFEQLDNGALLSLVNNAVLTNLQGPSKMTLARGLASTWDAKSKKPCNCTKSQCLKLYCDCFANGEFCSNCNCNNCYNNIQHELERFKAIKACLDRNPEAFQPKIGKGKLGDIKPRHNKGCNCKRSGCLKNYCECYEAKIMCSSICKCIGCKNYEESPDRKSLMNMPHCTETGRCPPTCISWEVVEATCACLLAQGEEAEKENYPVSLAEQMILEEFGSCLSQILHSEFKSKGLQIDQQLIN